MRRTIVAALAAFTFAGSVASAAEARDRRHRDNDGAVVAAGVAGLAIGAALASSARDRSYDRYGYGRSYGYAPQAGYYDPRFSGGYYGYASPPPRYGYYAPPPRYGYYGPAQRTAHRTCRVVNRWDPYYGGYVRIRRCW